MEPRFETFLRVGLNLIVGVKYYIAREEKLHLFFPSSQAFSSRISFVIPFPVRPFRFSKLIYAIRVVYQASELTGIVIRFISYVVTRLFSEGNRICRLTQFSTDPDFTGL